MGINAKERDGGKRGASAEDACLHFEDNVDNLPPLLPTLAGVKLAATGAQRRSRVESEKWAPTNARGYSKHFHSNRSIKSNQKKEHAFNPLKRYLNFRTANLLQRTVCAILDEDLRQWRLFDQFVSVASTRRIAAIERPTLLLFVRIHLVVSLLQRPQLQQPPPRSPLDLIRTDVRAGQTRV